MESPTFLSQRVTVPSLTDSPRAGIVMTVPPPVGAVGAGAETGAAGGGVGATAIGVGVWITGDGVEAVASVEMTANSAPTATV